MISSTLRKSLLLLCVLGCCLSSSVAQQPKGREAQARLDHLLEELSKVPSKEWKARMEALEAVALKHEAQAKKLKSKAQALLARAEEQERLARASRKGQERERQLMVLLRGRSPAQALVKRKAAAKPKPKRKPKVAAKRKPKVKAAKPKPKVAAKRKPKVKAAKPKPKAAAKPKPKAQPAMTPKTPARVASQASRKLSNFQDMVFPIIEEHCAACHHPDDRSGGLDLSSHTALMRGGGSGDVVIPGDPEKSRLFRLVSHEEQPNMPPDQGRIAAAKVAAIRQWIEDGALADAAAASKATQKVLSPGEASVAPAEKVATAPQTSAPALPASRSPGVVARGVRPVVLKALALSPAAPLLAIPGHRQILLHHRETRELLAVLDFPFESVEVLRFSRDGSRLLAAGGNPGRKGVVVLFDVRSGKEIRRFGREFDTVLAAALSPGMSLVALGGCAKKIRVYDTESGEKIYEITKHNDWIMSLDFSPDGNWLASADRGGGLFTWQAETGRNVSELRGHKGAIHALRFRPDAKSLASVGDDGTLRIWDFRRGRQTRRSKAHSGKALSVAWAADRRIVSGGSDGRVRLWRSDGRSLASLPKIGEWVLGVGLSKTAVYAAAWDGRLRIYDAKTRKERPGLITP